MLAPRLRRPGVLVGSIAREEAYAREQGDLPKDAGILRTAAQHNHANVGVYADVIEGGAIQRGDTVTLG